jgi:hypothetical protein
MPDSPQVSPPQLPGGVIVPPPRFTYVDYPGAIAIVIAVLGTLFLVLLAGKFDRTGGALTVSLLVVLAFIGILAYAVTVTVPRDETTAAVIGALTAGFGGVITYWLKNRGGGSNGEG